MIQGMWYLERIGASCRPQVLSHGVSSVDGHFLHFLLSLNESQYSRFPQIILYLDFLVRLPTKELQTKGFKKLKQHLLNVLKLPKKMRSLYRGHRMD